MSVKLVAITQPRVEGINTPAEFIAFAARVSNPKNQMNTETADKLLSYCVRNAHWSPFEMVTVVMEISCSRSIGRQILRHRSFSFQELSQRYMEISTSDFQTTEARIQDTKNRQNSLEIDDPILQAAWDAEQKKVARAAEKAYKWALKHDIAKEQARSVLPEGLTPSRMYMSGTLRSWIHFCELRMGNGTQKEHRIIAKEAYEILASEFPFLTAISGSHVQINITAISGKC